GPSSAHPEIAAGAGPQPRPDWPGLDSRGQAARSQLLLRCGTREAGQATEQRVTSLLCLTQDSNILILAYASDDRQPVRRASANEIIVRVAEWHGRPIITLGEHDMTDTETEGELKLARSYIAEAIKNAHSAIRTSWTIMFTAGTFGAVSTMSSVLRCKRNLYIPWITDYPVAKSSCHFNDHLVNYVLCFIVYFLTFARFYLGDCRIFDIKYSELFQLVLNEIGIT